MTNAVRENLLEALQWAKNNVANIEDQILEFDNHIDNNVYPTLQIAFSKIESRLRSYADQACEGSYCCGDNEYTQKFIVDGKKYLATLTVEYDRHDKTYYYIDGTEFRIQKLLDDEGQYVA